MNESEALERELMGVDARIEVAAVEGDAEEYLRLCMRRSALPYLIKMARTAPICREIERMEHELRALDEEAQSVREAPLPVVPPAQRGHVTPATLANTRLASINGRATQVGRELRNKRGELRRIEEEGPLHPA